jgi:hypothetical protein
LIRLPKIYRYDRETGFAKLLDMESKIAKDAERSLIEATQRLSPEERLNAYLEHCRLVMELYEAGQQICSKSLPSRASE